MGAAVVASVRAGVVRVGKSMRQLEEAVLEVLVEAKRGVECPGVAEISRRAGIWSGKGDIGKGEAGSVAHSIRRMPGRGRGQQAGGDLQREGRRQSEGLHSCVRAQSYWKPIRIRWMRRLPGCARAYFVRASLGQNSGAVSGSSRTVQLHVGDKD